jgi:prevent-host-death family protein
MDPRSSQTEQERDEPAHYNIADARRRFSDLVARAEAGEEIVISRGNHPVARLVPLPNARRRIAGRLKHWLREEERERLDHALLEPMSEEDLAIAEGVLTDEHGISINPAPKTS